MVDLFALPNEVILSAVNAILPCRQQQIQSLATLLTIRAAPCRNIVVHGLESTGKTTVLQTLLEKLSSNEYVEMDGAEEFEDMLRYAIVNSAECISGRQLLEQTSLALAKATGYRGTLGKCENLAQLAVDIGMLQEQWLQSSQGRKRLVIVFDGIDGQKEAPHTLLPALARLSEIIPYLTTIFVFTSPSPHHLHLPGVPHIHFPAYTKSELLTLLLLTPPSPTLPSGDADTTDVWSRFGGLIHDTFSRSCGRDILSFRSLCHRLWPKFIKPILENQLSPQPFSKLMLANRTLLANESALLSTSITEPLTTSTQPTTKIVNPLTSQLPHTSRILLLASYLCSHNPPKTDITFFSKSLAASKRRKRGGGTALSANRQAKNRKVSRRLLGPQVFTLERLLAVFHFMMLESRLSKADSAKRKRKGGDGREMNVSGSADVLSSISTLVSLRLITKVGAVGGSDVLDGGARYRVHVGWDLIRSLGRSVGIEVEEFVAE